MSHRLEKDVAVLCATDAELLSRASAVLLESSAAAGTDGAVGWDALSPALHTACGCISRNPLLALSLSPADRNALIAVTGRCVVEASDAQLVPTALSGLQTCLATGRQLREGGSDLSADTIVGLSAVVRHVVQHFFPLGDYTSFHAFMLLKEVLAFLLTAERSDAGVQATEVSPIEQLTMTTVSSLTDVLCSLKTSRSQTFGYTALTLACALASFAGKPLPFNPSELVAQCLRLAEACEALASEVDRSTLLIRCILIPIVLACKRVVGDDACDGDVAAAAIDRAMGTLGYMSGQETAVDSTSAPFFEAWVKALAEDTPVSAEDTGKVPSLQALLSVVSSTGRGAAAETSPTVEVEQAALKRLCDAFYRIDAEHAAHSVVFAALLTPGVVSHLVASLHACAAARASTSQDCTPHELIGVTMEAWLPLLQSTQTNSSNSGASAQGAGNSAWIASYAHSWFTRVFVAAGGVDIVVEYLSFHHPDVLSGEKLTAEATQVIMTRQAHLLAAWHVLEAVATHSPLCSAQTTFASAASTAIVGLLNFVTDLKGDAVQQLFSVPFGTEVCSTALRIVPALVRNCAGCVDAAAAGAVTPSRGTQLSAAALATAGAHIFADEEVLRTVATVVSTAAATGNVEVLTVGLDVLVVLSAAHPYAATLVVDFDFMSEAMWFWEEAGAEPSDNEVVADASLSVRDCLVLGTFRMMTVVVRAVPHAVNFEWIEVMERAMRLLPYQTTRQTLSTNNATELTSMREAYPMALLPCVVAAAEANEECREYIFEEELQSVLAKQLSMWAGELAAGENNATQCGLGGPMVVWLLTLGSYFPTPVSPDFCAAVQAIDLAAAGVRAVATTISPPLLRFLAVMALGAKERLSDSFVATALRYIVATVDFTAWPLVTPDIAKLITVQEKQGPEAFSLLTSALPHPAECDGDLKSASSCLRFITIILSRPSARDCCNERAAAELLDRAVACTRLCNQVTASGSSVSDAFLQYCQQIFLTVSLLLERGLDGDGAVAALLLDGEHGGSFLDDLAVLHRTSKGLDADAQPTGASQSCISFVFPLFATLVTRALRAPLCDKVAVTSLRGFSQLMLDSCVLHCSNEEVASALNSLLLHAEVREFYAHHSRERYIQLLGTLGDVLPSVFSAARVAQLAEEAATEADK